MVQHPYRQWSFILPQQAFLNCKRIILEVRVFDVLVKHSKKNKSHVPANSPKVLGNHRS